MDNLCKSGNCKQKISEYRESNRKLYDDIDGLESDIKEKDDFLQKVVKARNFLQNEVADLKKKNRVLQEDKNELVEKNEQLDEDAETGLMMVRKAHERERNLTKEVEEYKRNVIENNQKIKEIEKENMEVKAKLKFLKDKFETSLKENQASTTAKETKIKELEHKIFDAEEKTSSLHQDCYQKAVIDLKLKEQDDLIGLLRSEKDSHLMKIADLNDELVLKKKELYEFESQTLLKSASSSLSDELAQVGVFTCDQCNLNFRCEDELKDHKTRTHEAKLSKKLFVLSKLSFLENKVSEQKLQLTSSLYKLKEHEKKKRQFCTCKSFCRIFHNKHNYYHSASDEIFEKLEINSIVLNVSNNAESEHFGAKRKYYCCNQCEKTFQRQGDLKKHKKAEHRVKKSLNGGSTEL